MKDSIVLKLGFIIIFVIAVYFCIPKYEIYQSGDGTVTYRFNKVTGKMESKDIAGHWSESTPHSFLKKPSSKLSGEK